MKIAVYLLGAAFVAFVAYHFWNKPKEEATTTARQWNKRPGMMVEYIPREILTSGGLSFTGGLQPG